MKHPRGEWCHPCLVRAVLKRGVQDTPMWRDELDHKGVSTRGETLYTSRALLSTPRADPEAWGTAAVSCALLLFSEDFNF